MKFALKLSIVALASAALLAATPVNAMRIAPPPPGMRVAQASMIVIGKVESIEEKPVSAKQFPGAQEKAEYQIAVIKISDPILNAKGITTVRVGFVPPPKPQPGVFVRPGLGGPQFAKDQEVLVFLKPHHEANFMVAEAFYDMIPKQGNPAFEKETEEVKKFVKMLGNPKESLKAEKAEDRLAAAALLVSHYRARRNVGTEPKTEAIDADVSKLILTTLGEADWKATPGGPGGFYMSPMGIFNQLGLLEKGGDSFKPPMMEVMGKPQIDYAKLPEYAKQWCKDNAGKYKIERFVYEEKKKDDKKDEKKDK
jgi:hypothetical protein